jgi:hypothetical protein
MPSPMLLKQGDTLLGSLAIDDPDMPWWHGHFQPTPEYEPVRPIVEAWSRAVRDGDEAAMISAHPAFKALDLAIDRNDGGEPITRFLLYIDADRFRLRH